jgi:hypothetical protein
MALERDIQSELRVTEMDTITVPDANPYTGSAFDCQGVRGIDFVVLMADGALAGYDIDISFQDSPDGVTWTAVADDKVLPRDIASYQILDLDADGKYQCWGVTSVERYIRPVLTGITVPQEIDVYLLPIKWDEDRPHWEDGIDGLP